MATKKRSAVNRRSTVSFALGGMSRVGDSAAQQDKTRLASNILILPGRLQKRDGFANDNGPTITGGITGLIRSVTPAAERLLVTGVTVAANHSSYARKNDGTWLIDGASTGTGDIQAGPYPYTNGWDNTYGFCDPIPSGTVYQTNWSYNGGVTGTDFTAPVFGLPMYGSAIASTVRRIFIGAPNIQVAQILNNLGGGGDGYKFDLWTLTNATVAVVANLRTITFTAANGTVVSPGTYGGLGADAWFTWQQHFRASYTADAPLTLQFINNATGAVMAQREIIIPAVAVAGNGPDWVRFGLSCKVPAGVNFTLKIKAGTRDVAMPVNGTVDASIATAATDNTDDAKGALLTSGRYFYTKSAINSILGQRVSESYPTRIIWCETDDVTWWRSENFVDLKEAPGPITAIKVVGERVIAFKANAAWIFAVTDNVDAPLQFVEFVPGIGCQGWRAAVVAFDQLFFIDRNEVYQWDLQGPPNRLAWPAMREYLFDTAATAGITPLIEVDIDKRIVYVVLRAGQVHAYSIEAAAWTEIVTKLSGGTAVQVISMVYAQPAGETKRELWVTDGTRVCRLKSGQTTDVWDSGVNYTAEYWLPTLTSPAPGMDFTLERLDLEHLITNASAAVRADISFDNGATWPLTVTKNLDATHVGTNGDSGKPLPIPIRQTRSRMLIRLVSTSGGPESFAVTAASGEVIPRGRARYTDLTGTATL